MYYVYKNKNIFNINIKNHIYTNYFVMFVYFIYFDYSAFYESVFSGVLFVLSRW